MDHPDGAGPAAGNDDRVDTMRVGGAWVVRESGDVTPFPTRAAAVEAGRRLAVETGRDHVVIYASA